ncbi:MAG: hypothetical protein A3F31_04675 [Candidatus Levybacteria bacterium RIFCSPHIGHO2_12_FULL_38_12]|nr:MAG: hypothetical protein A2770_04360 [Candidatus Levybacteria bacterium RIFCSPHIGHO2_01_FULL_38_12]OGH21795.1 MAG: hypothetical protein A3D75_01230 [Candidatus Levybacteria bacterium RIFCSPHIGHO2_02_FULL_37_18]OGH22548.1 MAG: hypothetical protein A3F31_04675 [Candidatus Levybacteria bacterium RIFCSPHIGHO2_12_FULL_38_12]OGH33416.1 MAG: hypothetical protein A3A47_04180 [Candidatus Levybacteria bacterium RIFCSPLOWO2_01_FULL_37_20]OGH44085.1 MAG: hypothetical protein A3J14_05045 [Candidatus Lev
MNAKYLLLAGILLLVLGGGVFVFNSNKNKPVTAPALSQEETVKKLNPEDIGLAFTARNDKKAVKFMIEKIDDISNVDYEISYLAKGDIPRGAIGHADPEAGDTKIETNYIDLGTCSSGKCKYDEGVVSVKLLLKVTKKDNSIYSVEKTLDLTSD